MACARHVTRQTLSPIRVRLLGMLRRPLCYVMLHALVRAMEIGIDAEGNQRRVRRVLEDPLDAQRPNSTTEGSDQS